ncbi:MAG: putative membrane protein [Oceanicoccus sp.]|jgi:uncharacterized membrane protein
MFSGDGFWIFVELCLFVVVFVKLSKLKHSMKGLKQSKPVKRKAKAVANIVPSTDDYERGYDKGEPTVVNKLIVWMKEDFLMKMGSLMILLALTWFVRYSFLNDWIGPVGRVALGMLAGTGILAGGYLAMEKRRVPGQVLIVLGTTALLLTTFAAREYYDFFTPGSALGIMSLVVVLTTVIAIKERALSLAVTSFLGGIVAPLMTASPSQDYLVLSGYLFLLCLGVFVVVALRGWRELVSLAIISIAFYTLPFEIFDTLSVNVAWLFIGLFYALFFVGNSLGILHEKKVQVSDLVTTLLTVFLGIVWVESYVPVEAQSLVLAAVAILSMGVSLLFNERKMPIKSIYLHSAGAVVLLGAASIFEYDGEILAMVFAVEALIFVAMAAYLLKDKKAVIAAVGLQVVPVLIATESMTSRWGTDLFNIDALTLAFVALSLAGTALILHNFEKRGNEDPGSTTTKLISMAASSFFVFAIIWRSLEVYLTSDYAHGTALVIYTLVGLVLFFKGVVKHLKDFKWAGSAILALVLLRLVLVEIWTMSLVERIITFVVIGVLFILTAFFEKKSK